MERNFKNHIKWQEIDGEPLKVTPTRDTLDVEEIKSIFDFQVTETLTEDSETLLQNSVQINSSISSVSDVTVDLEIEGAPPYVIKRGGSTLAEDFTSFPFTETLTNDVLGEVTYTVENGAGNSDTSTVFHSPVEISSSISGPDVIITLDIDQAAPYDVYKNGSAFQQDVSFPFKDTVTSDGAVIYEVENGAGDTDNAELFPVAVSSSIVDSNVQLNLDVGGTGPYDILKQGEVIESDVEDAFFPFTETVSAVGEIAYTVENDAGNADTSTIVHSPVEVTCSVSAANVVLELDANEKPPFNIDKNGSDLQNDATFPYEDTITSDGPVTYEVENDVGYTDTCEALPIKTSATISGPTAEILLDVGGTGPYTITKNGNVIGQSVAETEFPYTDDVDIIGETTYEVENSGGNSDVSSVVYAPVGISCSVSESTVTLNLDISGTGSYVIKRDGTQIDQNVFVQEFPFTDEPGTGTYTYTVENDEGYSDTCTVTV